MAKLSNFADLVFFPKRNQWKWKYGDAWRDATFYNTKEEVLKAAQAYVLKLISYYRVTEVEIDTENITIRIHYTKPTKFIGGKKRRIIRKGEFPGQHP